MTWRVLVVDDEALARSNLQLALGEQPGWTCVGACANAAQARAALASLASRPGAAVDLVLLDIRMPRESGLSLAAELAASPAPPLIAFVTAYDAHALAAFEVHAIDYLLKPFDDARLAALLARADALLRLRQAASLAGSVQALAREQATLAQGGAMPALQEIVVRSVGQVERVAVAELRWVAAAGNYVELHLAGRTLLHRTPLSALAERLPSGEFLRVHRTALVRPGLIEQMRATGDGTWEARLQGGDTVPVSERHAGAVRALFAAR